MPDDDAVAQWMSAITKALDELRSEVRRLTDEAGKRTAVEEAQLKAANSRWESVKGLANLPIVQNAILQLIGFGGLGSLGYYMLQEERTPQPQPAPVPIHAPAVP